MKKEERDKRRLETLQKIREARQKEERNILRKERKFHKEMEEMFVKTNLKETVGAKGKKTKGKQNENGPKKVF